MCPPNSKQKYPPYLLPGLLSSQSPLPHPFKSSDPMMKFSAAARSYFPALRRHTFSFSVHPFPPHKMPSSSDPQSTTTNQIIEHIVLFKIKPTADPSAVSAMVTHLNRLISLDSLLHISAGPLLHCRSHSLTFTHILHSRYQSKSDLATYAHHPAHLHVVSNYGKPIVDDIMAVDWIVDEFNGPVVVRPGSAMRVTILKLKEEEESGKRKVMECLRGIEEKLASIEQATVGENFSPERAKGFSICSLEVFKAKEELEASESVVDERENEVREFVEETVVLDYTVEAPKAGMANP